MFREKTRRTVPQWLKVLGILTAVWWVLPAGAQQSGLDLTLRNDYIAIVVNASDENTGRFAVETTGGDPTRFDDDQQPLLYKQPGTGPRTSYTTVRVNGVDYVFGGSTRDRAGFSGTYGTPVQLPAIVDEPDGRKIVASWRLGEALVTQELRIVRSSTTGLYDTAEIAYVIQNVADAPAEIGLRVVLDTMLGANDGAPFRIGENAILTDTLYRGDELPDFFQAFDSLTEPRVIGQGTLRGPNITTPDRVYLTNWGAVADGIWDFSFQPGRDFTRLGGFELDSAMALYWDPVTYAPGESRRYVVHYGLGGISIVRGALSLGITSPASVDAARETSFPVVVYVQNAGESEALDVRVRICVPRGLTLEGNQSCLTRNLGDLPLGREAQVSWRVYLAGAVGGELEFTVEATAENLLEPVRVSRKINILGPPKLELSVQAPTTQVRGTYRPGDPPRQPVVVTVTNAGATAARDVVVSFSAPVGLELAPVDRADRLIGQLGPGESRDVVWQVALMGYTGNLPFTITAVDRESNVPPVTLTQFIDMLFPQSASLSLPGKGRPEEPVRVGELFSVDVEAVNVRRLADLTVEIAYDPAKVQFIKGPGELYAALRGDLFLLTAQQAQALGRGQEAILPPWTVTHIPAGADGLARIRIVATRAGLNPLQAATGTVASLWFKALAPGETPIDLTVFRVGLESTAISPDAPSQVARRGVVVHVVP